ncbi:MAG TPA: hypothetical protein PKK43_06085 [Spirochaetota bacterium]|nr:hypothetical protein [Spirochaetota bacterium]
MKSALSGVLKYYGCEELLLPIFTCINELLVNAVKANYKNIYFESYNPRNTLSSRIPYEKALEIFRFEISSEGARSFSRLAEEKGLKAVLRVSVKNDIMHVSVINNSIMTDIEKHNVKFKIETVGKLEQMSDFFGIDNDTANEGAGLGIVLIGMMLKSLGLGSENLSICPEMDSTTATLTIPLNASTLDACKIVSGGD